MNQQKTLIVGGYYSNGDRLSSRLYKVTNKAELQEFMDRYNDLDINKNMKLETLTSRDAQHISEVAQSDSRYEDPFFMTVLIEGNSAIKYGHKEGLFLAAFDYNDSLSMKIATEAGATGDGFTKNGVPLIHQAIFDANPEILSMMAKNTKKLESTWEGMTPLMTAVKSRKYGAMRIFIEAGANINFTNPNNGLSIMDSAIENGDLKAAKILTRSQGRSLLSSYKDRRLVDYFPDELEATIIANMRKKAA